jgi:hypothetical protein
MRKILSNIIGSKNVSLKISKNVQRRMQNLDGVKKITIFEGPKVHDYLCHTIILSQF